MAPPCRVEDKAAGGGREISVELNSIAVARNNDSLLS
jgi:hypothetical protein